MSPDSERTAHEYDAIAVEYAADNASGAYNAFYERPATTALLGDVKGCRVLDAGCGSGELTAWLVDHGALVTAFDVSPEMTGLARQRAGGRRPSSSPISPSRFGLPAPESSM